MAQDYKDLLVWKKAIDLTVCVYQLTRSLPSDELYGLSSQFLGVAQGSTYELQTQLLVAKNLRLANQDSLERAELLSNEVSKMLTSFIHTLNFAAGKNKLAARS
jgi:hypothetical protein